MPRASSAPPADLRLLEPFWREQVFRSVLPNGATLLVKPDRSAALASVQVWVRTGSLHEGPWLGAGISHYLEHMLFKGTARRAGREISSLVQAHGGYINAYTTYDRTVYYIDLPSEHAAVAIDLLADAVLHSSLPPDEAAKEKDVILREIAMVRDDPDQRLWENLFASAFREHPYRHPIIGHRDAFAALSPEDLAAYYRARYVPDNLVVVVVGDVDPAAVRAEVERSFGASPRTRLAPVFVPPEPAQLAPREDHRGEDVEVARVALAWPIPGLGHPDSPALDLLAMVLGHGDSSLLWQEVRERAGLVHTIDAASWNPGSSGLFCISFTCDADKREAATAAVGRVLERAAARGFAPALLRRALRQLVVGEINTRKTMSGQASRLGVAEVVVGDLDYGRTYFARLGGVKPADLLRVLRQTAAPSRRVAVSIHPPSPPSAAPARAAAAERGGLSELTLPNGARLLLQPDRRLPNLHLRLIFAGGPLQEEPERRGSTALLATLLTKDTARRSAAEVARAIESVGGAFHAFSGNNSFGLAVEVLPPDAARALDILAEAALAPAFKPSAFALERDAQIAALRQDTDDVVTFARKLVRQKFFGRHPLALDAQGDEAGVKALAPKHLAALHRGLCVGPNAVLSVAGDFDPRRLAPSLRAFLARFSRAAPPASRAGSFSPRSGDFVEKREREQAVVLQAFPGPRVHAADFYVGEVADEVFSGMASRLFERVREEKGLAYFVRSFRVSGLDASLFGFISGTQPGRERDVLVEIEAEIARMKAGGIEADELRRCQSRLKTAHRERLQTNASRAMQAGLNVLQGQPADDEKHYDRRIEAVTAKHLADFARRYFDPALRTQLIVAP